MLLKLNSTGSDVKDWQNFLIAQKLLSGKASGTFDKATLDATKKFQTAQKLTSDGIVGNETRSVAQSLGFDPDDGDESTLGISTDIVAAADKRLTKQDIEKQAKVLKIAPAALKAVTDVEARGSGFLSNGQQKILFEGHIFWNELQAVGKDPQKISNASNADILYPKWTKQFYKGGAGEYDRLERARKIDSKAANRSTSWGMFQIMGFNCLAAGYASAEAMITAFDTHEREHLKAFGLFVSNRNMLTFLQQKNWAEFAKRYNGPKYKLNNYDQKLALAYADAIRNGYAG
ncbi:MAG: N-acetylmuramidase family protein [Candidatus Kapabacteria bacterium]|nr:N-acetylmuramidase family protein [Candidatus Kapabacteria bacterium]